MGREEDIVGNSTESGPNKVPPAGGKPVRIIDRLHSLIVGNWPIWLISLSTFVNGILNIFLIFIFHFSNMPQLFGWVVPYGIYYFNNSLTVMLGFFLIFLSFNLFQRRRVAWWLAVIGSGISIIINISQTQFWTAVISPVITLILLVMYRKRYTVRSEIHNITRGLRFMFLSLVIALVYGVIGFLFLYRNDFGIPFGFAEALIRSFRELILIGNSDLVAQTAYAVWFLNSLRIVGILAYAFALYSLFRPIAYRYAVLPYENLRAETIRDHYGRFAYDYFKVWPDKSYYFSKSGNSFLSYRVEWNVAVVLGDPVGLDKDLEKSIREFINYCADNDWGTVFLFPEQLEVYPGCGLHLLKIGEEGIIDLEHFAAQVSHKKYFRHIQNKFLKLGYHFIRYTPPLDRYLLSELQDISDQWLNLPGHREFGFVQGEFDKNYLSKMPVSIMRNSTEQAVAFVNEVPSYRKGETNFDLMRHVPDVPNGTMDYIFLNLMLVLKDSGFKKFAMGVAPFAGLGKSPGASLTEKTLHQLQHFDWFVHSKGIYQYKLKFEPVWEDRFIAYRGSSLALPKIALAITRAVERDYSR